MSIEMRGAVYWSLYEACRIAADHRPESIGTDLVLIGMMRRSPQLRRVLDLPPSREVAYRADAGYPDRESWDSHLELEVLRTMREVHWRVFGWAPADACSSDVPQWDPESIQALLTAASISIADGCRQVGGDHVLQALLASPSSGAGGFVARQRLDPVLLLEAARQTWLNGDDEKPHVGIADSLWHVGVVVKPDADQSLLTTLKRRWLDRFSRWAAQTTAVLSFLELEAVAETVRFGHDRTTLEHLISAALVFEDEMMSKGLVPSAGYLAANNFALRPSGLNRQAVNDIVNATSPDGAIAPPQRGRAWRSNPKNPPWTVAAARAAEVARRISAHGRKLPAGSAHLIYAVLSDADDSGRQLLRSSSVDPIAVRRELADRLGIVGKVGDQF